MQKSSVEVAVPFEKHKIPRYRGPNERNAKGGSMTINFHSSWKWELEFLPTALAVILMPVALPILLKVEFSFEVIMYITIFVSHIQKGALNMWSVTKTYLKVLLYLLKTQSSNFSMLGMETRPWKFNIWPATCHYYLHFLSAQLFRTPKVL